MLEIGEWIGRAENAEARVAELEAAVRTVLHVYNSDDVGCTEEAAAYDALADLVPSKRAADSVSEPQKEKTMNYRKKPVTIQAIRASEAIRAATNDWKALPKWLADAYEKGGVVFAPDGIHLPTLEGTMLARLDDMIICGVQGEIYPCKPDIFEATYEAIDG
jgi:hypothetical protein